jgi:hypothetical protein
MTEQPEKKQYNRKRDNQIIVRFSDEELAELNEAIEKSGLSKTDYFLQLLRNSNVIIMTDLKEICVELKRQGINLNQALRNNHETIFTEKIKTAIENCNELYEKAKNIFLSADNNIQTTIYDKISKDTSDSLKSYNDSIKALKKQKREFWRFEGIKEAIFWSMSIGLIGYIGKWGFELYRMDLPVIVWQIIFVISGIPFLIYFCSVIDKKVGNKK